MKKFLSYFQDFFADGFDWRLHLVVMVFLGISLWLNFTYKFEQDYIGYRSWKSVIGFFFLQTFPFYVVVAFQCYFKEDWSIFSNSTFWRITILGFAILAFSRGFPYSEDIGNIFPQGLRRFGLSCLEKFKRVFVLILPLFILFWATKKQIEYEHYFYGLTLKNVHVQPYVILLLLMVPLIYFASLDDSFLRAYPRYRSYNAHLYLKVPEYVTVAIYEFCYGIGFVGVELFFRGFLIIGLAFLLGKGVVLPMAATYVFLHFGKPPGEAISSFFGGYILGVIALYSGNIWGGVFVHIGIAWLMEAMAWLQLTKLANTNS
jgi:hypothetical protein